MKFEDIKFEIEQLNYKKDAELRRLGWTDTSSTPGCIWLWYKEVKGYGKMWVNRDTAIYISEWEAHQ